MYKLELKNISVMLGKYLALKDISLFVNRGECLSVIGPSGCGKSTLLRTIIGLNPCHSGKILLDGADITQKASADRGMSIIFQNYVLFNNLSVLDNLVLVISGKNKKEKQEKSYELLKKMSLENHANKFPFQLSGGQQQRVAIARAICNNQKIILLDEPMAALDPEMRVNLRQEIIKLQKSEDITIINVTHDLEEAFIISDRIAIMNTATIEQIGTPSDLYFTPCTKYVENFVRKQIDTKKRYLKEFYEKENFQI